MEALCARLIDQLPPGPGRQGCVARPTAATGGGSCYCQLLLPAAATASCYCQLLLQLLRAVHAVPVCLGPTVRASPARRPLAAAGAAALRPTRRQLASWPCELAGSDWQASAGQHRHAVCWECKLKPAWNCLCVSRRAWTDFCRLKACAPCTGLLERRRSASEDVLLMAVMSRCAVVGLRQYCIGQMTQ